jgi:hypothetical protein
MRHDLTARALLIAIYAAHLRTLGWGHLDNVLRWITDTVDTLAPKGGRISSAVLRQMHRAWMFAWHRWDHADRMHRRRCIRRAEHCGYQLTGDNYHRPGGQYS